MTTDLTTKKTTSIIDATKETDNAVYEVRYQVVDVKGTKTLQALHAEVYERNLGEGMQNIGYMDYDGSGISMKGFPASERTSAFVGDFMALVEECKAAVCNVQTLPVL